jgi:hypothetical protein
MAALSKKPPKDSSSDVYHRYHLETSPAPDIAPPPSRFRVKIKRQRLAQFLIREVIHHRGNRKVILSRPCVYGVFSGPVGGFWARQQLCVGCLRCTTEHPETVQIYHNPEHHRLGDSYFTPGYVDSVHYEARTGRIPVKGAGYRGPFGGSGWDGMWTDMSEIVRPTRDGIHGREFISTSVDIGTKPPFIVLNEQGWPIQTSSSSVSLPVPILFDAPPLSLLSERILKVLASAALETKSLLLLPAWTIKKFALEQYPIVPLVSTENWDEFRGVPLKPPMIELDGWNEELYGKIRRRFPESIFCLRLDFSLAEQLAQLYQSGIRVFHLVADYHGRGGNGRFVLDLIREVHRTFVALGCRDQVTLLASGGIIAAEHLAKAIICGLDAVVLDTPLLVALQAQFLGECRDRHTSRFRFPGRLNIAWGVGRIRNLVASWRDQLLEVMGAMGLREVRRLRGETGRAMFQADLEREAFSGIEGYAEQ